MARKKKSMDRNVEAAVQGTGRESKTKASWDFAQILEHIDIGIMVLDLKYQAVDYRNPIFDQILPNDQHTDDFKFFYNLMLQKHEINHSSDLTAYVNQQIKYHGRLIGYSIYKPDIRYRCIFLRDITEKSQLKSIAQAVNAMDNIGFIFSGIRHEIGNPLNSLKMTLSVLQENLEKFSLEIVNEYIDRGIADIGRIEYLLKSLKTYSLYEHAELIDLPLEKFMNKFLSLIERDFQSQGIQILVESSFNISKIRIDKRALHQALLNIFNNAAEAFEGHPDPQIKIAAELRGQLVWLTISDNGCGISSNQLKHLFKPFNTSKPGGNGLGLVITRKLLALMASDIDITSEPDKGTCVTIRLQSVE